MIEQPAPRARRRVLLVGAGLGGVVLGVVLLATVFGGKGDEVSVESPRPAAPAAARQPAVPEGPPADVTVTSVPAAGRDPFQQVVTAPENAPAAGGQSAQTAQPTPVPSTSPEPTPPSAGAGGAAADKLADAGHATLELTSVLRDETGGERADITVDGEPYRPAEGDVFSFGFRLEDVDGNCVEVSAGQDRVRMCLPATTTRP